MILFFGKFIVFFPKYKNIYDYFLASFDNFAFDVDGTRMTRIKRIKADFYNLLIYQRKSASSVSSAFYSYIDHPVEKWIFGTGAERYRKNRLASHEPIQFLCRYPCRKHDPRIDP